MDTSVERRSDPRFTARKHGPPLEILGPLEPRVGGGEGWRLVDVLLTGGAPWGFSLKGGLEYNEPLIITKVEEGSQAWAVRLQVGDEVVAVNDLPLSGYRQEAIGLVKGSHKTLVLGVRRRHEPVNRPHSWHSVKFSEAQSKALRRQTTDTVVSQSRYDASLSSDDLSSGWDQTNLQLVSNQFSSLGSMDSLEHCPHPYPTGHLTPAKPSNSTEYLGGSKLDSAYSSFSTGSGTPDHTLSRSNTASTESVACKAGAWDSQNWQSLDERQVVGHVGGRDSPRHSGSTAGGRSNMGPVWHVPEKKRTAPPSPPPPPLPVRSHSFAVTKVHEKEPVIPYCKAPNPYAEQRPPGQGRGADRASEGASRGHQMDDRGPGVRWSYNPPSKNDEPYPPHSSGSSSQQSSNKLSSLSSTEVPASHGLHSCAPRHQRQYSDESTFYPRPRAPPVATAPRASDAGSSYSSTPTNSLQQPSTEGHAWASTASITSALEPVPCVTAGHQPLLREEDSKGGVGVTQEAKETDRNSKSHKAKQPQPPPQRRSPNDQDRDRYGRHEGPPLERLADKPNGNERRSQGRDQGSQAESHYINYPLRKPEEEEGQALKPREVPRDVLLPPEDMRSQDGMGTEAGPRDPKNGQQVMQNNRYATALRNEIRNRKVQLHKSRSTAELTGPDQARAKEEGAEVSAETSASSSDGSFSSTYKDHLKEVQARVLQATSFRRRDLEPEALPFAPSPTPILHPEAPPHAGNVVSRIGGRKRFPPEKKVRSVSEPNKIHEMGVAGPEPELEPSRPAEHAGSLADRRKVFELTGKPVFQKPLLKQARQGSPEEPSGDRTKGGVRGGTNTSRAHPEGQRLGTFAEYEATWNVQRKPSEIRPTGKYHSADDILDPAVEEQTRTSYIHERSRSSPSTELQGQNILAPGRKSAEFSHPECKPTGHKGTPPRASEQKHGVLRGRQSPSQQDRFPEPPPEGAPRDDPESRGRAAPLPPDHGHPHHHRDRPHPRNPEAPPPYRESQSRGGSAPGEAALVAPRAPLQPKPEMCRRSEGAPSPRGDPRPGTGPEEGNRRATLGADNSQREPLPPPPPPPTSSSSSDPASQLHPPCPHVPQRPADQPPASLPHNAPCRMETLSETSNSSTEKKLPVRMIQEPENCPPSIPDEPPIGPAQEPRPPACVYREQRRAEGQDRAHPGAPLEAPPPQPASTNGVSPAEEQKREELARDIVDRDKSLADILDQSGMKTTMDLMKGIFPEGGVLLEGAEQRRKPAPRQTPQDPRISKERREEENMAAAVGMVTNSSYYYTSAPMAELLMKMKDMPGSDSEDELDMDLAHKKHQLIDSLSQKLRVLREVRESLLEDVRSNNALGEEVESGVERVCRPNEVDKFRMFVGDLDKVVSLLLSLSGRLARVENALNTLHEDAAEEKRTLTEKRKVLLRQHEDAKELKDNLDRRERVVSHILTSHLTDEHLADFRHFVKMKAALIMEQRKLDDKIKLGEEQLKCLMDSLPPDHRPPF
ncbi:hypothetical protein SKAU_G00255780 [Synaphobranchus kaupii]|uniref:Protein Shroom2 n=1 Tax=Synaphobranchus kaupii TaxID=118154 RepID=A0A9Q1F3S0_SYNKA|nr:hypothetical protein SKAU_G00255780 [Synaphobranchus kaupii]